MPRERVIATSDHTYSAGLPAHDDQPAIPGCTPGVEVQWTPMQHSDGQAVVAVASGHLTDRHLEGDDPGTATTPYFTFLTRQDINRLITVLRRARNAVYGTDE